MRISQYFCDFILFSLIGWVYECTFVSMRTKHWDNRGFLFGPVCPIYGIGATAVVALFENVPFFSSGTQPYWKLFLIFAAGSAVLEFSTSWVLEKFFHAVWWNYSRMPFNVQGRICLPYTICFGIAGCLIARFVVPGMELLHSFVSPLMDEIGALFFMGLLGGDIALTVSSLTDLLMRLEENEKRFNEHMEMALEDLNYLASEAKDKVDIRKLPHKLPSVLTGPQIAQGFLQHRIHMSWRDSYTLSSILEIRSNTKRSPAVSVRLAISNLGKHLGTPISRAVNNDFGQEDCKTEENKP